MATDMNVSRYSKRLLNPFTGTAQIIETPNARAISIDGLKWRLHIRSAIFKTPWQELAVAPARDQYFVYGIWSSQQGLARVPIHPTLYAEHVEDDAAELVALIQQYTPELPFAAQDGLELWLLDARSKQPVALIASRCEHEALSRPANLDWLPCKFEDRSFTSSACARKQAQATIPSLARDLLSEVVKQRVGQHATAVWIKRNNSAQVEIVQGLSRRETNDFGDLHSAAFPDLPLTQDWVDEEQTQLCQDYLAWLSPVLLTLTALDTQTRSRLEQQAQHYPLSVFRLHRLYPLVCDRALLNKVLVEARLRGARV